MKEKLLKRLLKSRCIIGVQAYTICDTRLDHGFTSLNSKLKNKGFYKNDYFITVSTGKIAFSHGILIK